MTETTPTNLTAQQHDSSAQPQQHDPSAQQPLQVGAGRASIGDIAPRLAELTDDLLFAEVWNRPGLSARDRSLVTVAALVASGDTEQLRFHLGRAQENGVGEGELVEAITHLAFYAGWPKAMSAVAVARQVLTA